MTQAGLGIGTRHRARGRTTKQGQLPYSLAAVQGDTGGAGDGHQAAKAAPPTACVQLDVRHDLGDALQQGGVRGSRHGVLQHHHGAEHTTPWCHTAQTPLMTLVHANAS